MERRSGMAKMNYVHHGRFWPGEGRQYRPLGINRSVMYEIEGREGMVVQKPRAVVAFCLVSECVQHCALVPLLSIHTGGW